MKTSVLDSKSKRIGMALAVLIAVVLLAAGIYIFVGGTSMPQANGIKIISAAHTYTRSLQQRHQPVPHSVPLQLLIDQGLLQPADVGSFQGMDAIIYLTTTKGVQTELMRVHMHDGTDLVLLADGSSQQVKR